MATAVIMPDGTKCYSGSSCKRHSQNRKEWIKANPGLDYTKISKTISYLLRHKPETAGLTLQPGGWVDVQHLIHGINQTTKLPRPITLHDIHHIVEIDSKKRYSLKEGQIRAVQGHSTKVEMEYKPVQPPKYLYHGTVIENLNSIRDTGLKPMTRQHVHLSENYETAVSIAKRHGNKIHILKVDAEKAHENGVKFYKAENGVWLADSVPKTYLT
jgi:putative RNA 2'-phosphotransferase